MDINERCYGYEPAQSQLTQLQTTVMNLHEQLEGATKQHKADVDELHERLLTISHERGKRMKLEAQLAELNKMLLNPLGSIEPIRKENAELKKQLEAVRGLFPMARSKARSFVWIHEVEAAIGEGEG